MFSSGPCVCPSKALKISMSPSTIEQLLDGSRSGAKCRSMFFKLPKLTCKLTGHVNGDSASKVTDTPSETTPAKKTHVAGTYPIKLAAGSLASAATPSDLVNGTVTFTPAANTEER